MAAGIMPAIMAMVVMTMGRARLRPASTGEFRAPMSIAVIGGLLSSTLLSLVFVPAAFAVMDDIGGLAWRVCSRFIGPTEEEPPAAAPAPPACPSRKCGACR